MSDAGFPQTTPSQCRRSARGCCAPRWAGHRRGAGGSGGRRDHGQSRRVPLARSVGRGREPTGLTLSAADAERIIRLVAAHVRVEVHAGAPDRLGGAPGDGRALRGHLAAGRARAGLRHSQARELESSDSRAYVADGILTEAQAACLRQAVRERRNILIAGGTSTGKTTLANALLPRSRCTDDRVIVLEDTVELQCAADDHVPLRTKPASCPWRTRALDPAPAARPHHRRRSARRRGARSAEGLGHRPSRRHRHPSRGVRARRAHAASSN